MNIEIGYCDDCKKLAPVHVERHGYNYCIECIKKEFEEFERIHGRGTAPTD